MKKKIVNLIVSAAVVTSMMFAVTACGSKDDSANNTTTGAVVESATPETTAPAEEPTVAATTEAATAEATTAEATTEATTDAEASGDSTSLEEWINSDVAVAMLDEMNQGLAGQGMTIKFEADGDTFSMIFVMEQELEITDEIKDAMKQLFDGSSAIFESARDELISETRNENIKLRITYQDINGTELYSQDF